MALDDLAIDSITEDALDRLIQSQVREGYTTEYKLELFGGGDSDKKELLKDVSSFANSSGGHIVFGMRAVDGLPKELVGIADEPDRTLLRIENLFRDCIEPRIVGLTPKVVSLANGRWALVLRIPRSWNRPHRASYQNWTKYFVRNAAGVHEAGVEELRGLFNDASTREARVTNFISERIALVEAGRGPIPVLRHGGRVILHLVPFGVWAGDAEVDLAKAIQTGRFPPIGTTGYNNSYNMYGAILTRAQQDNGYTQIFRNGTIETVGTDIGTLGTNRPGIHGFVLGRSITQAIESFATGYEAIGVAPPISISVTLTGVEGLQVVCGDERSYPLPISEFRLPEVTIDRFTPGFQATLRPIMDAIWNAGGMPRCNRFRDDGRWVSD